MIARIRAFSPTRRAVEKLAAKAKRRPLERGGERKFWVKLRYAGSYEKPELKPRNFGDWLPKINFAFFSISGLTQAGTSGMFSPVPEANPRPMLGTKALFADLINASGRRRTAIAIVPVPDPLRRPNPRRGPARRPEASSERAQAICPVVSNEETLDMTMIVALVWGGRKTGTEITGCTRDRAERQVMDRIVETGGRCCLVADSRISCSRQKATPTGMSFGNRWVADRCAPVLDFRIDRLSSGRHGESEFGNGKGGGGRKLGLKLRHVGSCKKAWLAVVGTGTVAG